jgi:hypothetical protein
MNPPVTRAVSFPAKLSSKESNQVAKSKHQARRLLTVVAAAQWVATGIAAVAIFTACSGSSAVTPVGSVGQSSAVTMHMPSVNPDHKTRCSHHGDVRVDVDPCSITFSASNPGPDTVTVNVPEDKKGTISESDNCGGASGVATVAQGSGDEWTVSAGATTGSCTATFDFANRRGKVVGSAGLSITNTI